jgi:hypothetical protein
MAGCGSDHNCTDLFTSVTITVLPDIVGIGVCTACFKGGLDWPDYHRF